MNGIETATSEKTNTFIYASRGWIRGCAEGSQATAISSTPQELISRHRMCCPFATVIPDKYTDQPQLLTLLCPVSYLRTQSRKQQLADRGAKEARKSIKTTDRLAMSAACPQSHGYEIVS